MFKNKKFLAGAVCVLIGLTIALSALTGAWFVQRGDDEVGQIDLHRLKIEADVTNGAIGGALEEPGAEAIFSDGFTIKNTGSATALIEVKFSASTTLKSTLPDGDPIANPNDYVVVPNDPNVIISWNTDEMFWHADADGVYFWVYNSAQDQYFLYIDAGLEVDLSGTIIALLDGPGMGNNYMDAEITLTLNWRATQGLYDGAIMELFGFVLEDAGEPSNPDVTIVHNYDPDFMV